MEGIRSNMLYSCTTISKTKVHKYKYNKLINMSFALKTGLYCEVQTVRHQTRTTKAPLLILGTQINP